MSILKLNDLNIATDDSKSFNEWTKLQPEFFENSNFLTGLLNLELKNSLPKSYLEFYFYNKNFLANKYHLPIIDLFIINEPILEEFVLSMINIHLSLPLEDFNNFYSLVLNYKRNSKTKDWNQEYKLLKPYWKFLDAMEHSKVFDFNQFIIYLNTNIFSKQKGIDSGK